MNQGTSKYQDHGYTMFHPKVVNDSKSHYPAKQLSQITGNYQKFKTAFLNI